MSMNRCAACGHTHEGPGLAGICVGCPCPVRPEQPAGLDADLVHYLDQAFLVHYLDQALRKAQDHAAAELAAADPGGTYSVICRGQVMAYENVRGILDVLLEEADLSAQSNGR